LKRIQNTRILTAPKLKELKQTKVNVISVGTSAVSGEVLLDFLQLLHQNGGSVSVVVKAL
jgi:hypothetical protein